MMHLCKDVLVVKSGLTRRKRSQTTLYNFYMAVLWALLARLTDADGVCIGVVDTG